MAQSISGFTPFTTDAWTVPPQNATGNVTGTSISTAPIGGGMLTMFFRTGAVNTLTSVICYAETSADGVSWVPALGIGNDTTPNITLTAANTNGAINFLVPTGNVSQYVRGNVVLTGTSANVTALIMGQNRLDTATGYQNTPPNPNQ